jgi:hypothetical protein
MYFPHGRKYCTWGREQLCREKYIINFSLLSISETICCFFSWPFGLGALFCCGWWWCILAFTKVLIIYQIYHT